MRTRHILALLHLSVALVASTAAKGQEQWNPADPTHGITLHGIYALTPHGMMSQEDAERYRSHYIEVDSVLKSGSPSPVVIQVGQPYRPSYSPTADFSERVSNCVVSATESDALSVVPLPMPTALNSMCDSTAMHVCPEMAPAFVAMMPPSPYCPAQCSATCQPASTISPDAAKSLEHILQAIHHLEAAGLQDEADELRAVSVGELEGAAHRCKTAEGDSAKVRAQSVRPYECVKPASAELPADHPFSVLPLGD